MLLPIQSVKPRRRKDMFDLYVKATSHLSDLYLSEALCAPWLVQAIWLVDNAGKVFDSSYEYPRITINEGFNWYSALVNITNEMINGNTDDAITLMHSLIDELSGVLSEIRETTSFSTITGRELLERELLSFVDNCTKGSGFKEYEHVIADVVNDPMRNVIRRIRDIKEHIVKARR